MKSIFILPRLTPEQQEELKQDYYSRQHLSYISTLLEHNEIVYMDHSAPNGYVCDNNKCFEKMIEKYLKSGERPHLREWRWTKEICVYLDQLNEDGIYDLAYGYENDNEGYINSFRDYHCQPTRFIDA